MDRLPVELVSTVAAHLQIYNLDVEPFSYLTETSPDRTIGWLTLTASSRQDICSFRLVCRKCHDSSTSSFGAVLGNRVFRITKAGLEDLRAVSAVAALRPHIKTLTFGNAQFDDISSDPPPALHNLLALIPEPDKTRLHNTYMEAFDWQQSQGKDAWYHGMITISSCFRNLTNLRLLSSDYPGLHTPLGGWLDSNDGKIIARVCANREGVCFDDENIYKLNYEDITICSPVFDALKHTITKIRDLRVGFVDATPPSDLLRILHTTGMNSSLRYLRLDIDPRSLCPGTQDYSCDMWTQALGSLINLVQLSISLANEAGFQSFELATANLVKVLRPIIRLKKLTIRGVWHYNEDGLVDLVTAHSSTLMQLALKGPILQDGSWASVIRRLLYLRLCTLQHLQFSSKNLKLSNTRFIPAFDASDWENFVKSIKGIIE